MKRFAMMALLMLAPALILFAADDKSANPEGSYKVTGLTKGGMKPPGDPSELIEGVTIKGDKIKIKMFGEEKVATIKIDTKAKPATIDLTPDEGDKKGQTMKGIWKMEKNVLTIVLIEGKDEKRPENFDAKGEKEMMLELTKKEDKKQNEK